MAEDPNAALLAAMRRRYGAAVRLEDIVEPTLGGSNRTVLFDVVDGAARRRLASRQITYYGPDEPFLTAAQQFRAMQVAFRHGFPVPEPLFLFDAADGLGEGFVTAFVAGETMPRRLLDGAGFAAARAGLAGRLGAAFARLHAISPEEVAFLAERPDSRDPIAAQRWRLDIYDEPHPAIEFGLRWLERHRPAAVPPRFLHGDLRTGNLMVAPDGLAAVLDWECCHLGDPAEDLGWLCARSWRFGRFDRPVGGFGARADLFAAYEAAGGGRVEPERVRWWEIFGMVRWAALNVWQGYGHVVGGRRSPAFAACGRNTSLIEYDLLMTLAGRYD